eukprot:TRINITY_DN9624_c0_g4_i1.p1 TRINITY_DN9624_c0_g4~~TRINITY_DN9624_c0_g4_i1.p1  ORF type:complete len:1073 (-),score=172.48 TRINITY_DN9624_c0_g4_i1:50-3226(-)
MSASVDASRDSRRVVSASNDSLVKVWRVDEEKFGFCVAGALVSLRYHVDYVTCLAYAPQRSLLASAGLDARVVVSDVEAATRVLTVTPEDSEPYVGTPPRRSTTPTQHRGGSSSATASVQRCTVGLFSGMGQYIPQLLTSPNRENHAYEQSRPNFGEEGSGGGGGGTSGGGGASVWSLASMPNASLLVCGTASCVVRGWDPRSGKRLWRLRGHTENVRALAMSEDGSICISGSADRTIRVWDVGMRRCVHVFDAHQDSVWALAVPGHSCGYALGTSDPAGGVGGGFTEVFSGGRDGLLLRHDLRLMQTNLVLREPSALQALAVAAGGSDLWASATDSHVRIHSLPSSLVPHNGGLFSGYYCDGEAIDLPPPVSDDNVVIVGTPRLTDYRVLHNKRQVLVKDACDNIALWDVTNGQCYDIPATLTGAGSCKGDEAIKRALAHVNKTVSVPNWFTCDLSLGCLSVFLEVSQCFKAESEDADLVVPGGSAVGSRNLNCGIMSRDYLSQVSSAAPVNLGARALRALFESWVHLPPTGAAGPHTQSLTGTTGARPSRGSSSVRQAPRASRRPRHEYALPENAHDETSARTSGYGSGAAPGRHGQAGSGHSSHGGHGSHGHGGHGGLYPRVFTSPPAMQEQPHGGGAVRWDDDQPPGTPADSVGGVVEPPAGSTASPSSFPPATALMLVGRSGRAIGFRGRLFCGLFSGGEAPDLLPSWVVDVVWNQRPPPEDLCGERTMPFSVVRCSSEMALPALPTPYCLASPGMRVNRVMGYLVRALDFDWSSPAKNIGRRPSGAVSLVSRLGRCCAVPTSGRGRAASGDSWGSQSDGCDGGSPVVSPSVCGASPVGGSSTGGSRRGRSTSRERSVTFGGQSSSSSSARRPFGLRRGEDDSHGVGNGVVGRVRIDGSPAPLPSVPAQSAGSGRRGAGPALEPVPGGHAPLDERYVEVLCNDELLDPDMTLATVRDFIWKRTSVELVLQYRRATRVVMPSSPPPPPPLLPGSGAKDQSLSGGVTGGDVQIGEELSSDMRLNGGDDDAGMTKDLRLTDANARRLPERPLKGSQ